ncbi:putative Mitogen-activated protein kinase kinase kinase 11 [Nannochloris sp. 'desiccata']|nr:hypothetical protein KSW81_004797 [Chlorella desiccata (nom. nud.)]KAH7618235.1 putative Mitogen-activated protein kinase kinase kinase 11 [Chlorella desiccata (nom. nud.)]
MANQEEVAIQAALSLEETLNLYATSTFDSDPARIEAVRKTGLLDTTPEQRFDSLTSLAASLFDVPVAIVTLLDARRSWYKSSIGLEGEIQREYSACSYISVPDYAEMIVAEQCNEDSRYSENPFIKGPPDIRYYAGCPLVASKGQRLGTLCLVDFKSRHFSSSAYNILANLAEIAAREVERDVVKKCYTPVLAPAAEEAIFIVDVSKPSWPLVYCNQAWANLFDLDDDPTDLQDQGMWDVLSVRPPEEKVIAAKKAGLAEGNPLNIFLRVTGKEIDETSHDVVRLRCFLAGQDRLENSVPVAIPGVVPAIEYSGGSDLEALSLPVTDLWIGTAHKMLEKDGSSAPSGLKMPLLRDEGVALVDPTHEDSGVVMAMLQEENQHQKQQENCGGMQKTTFDGDFEMLFRFKEEKAFNLRSAQAIKPPRKPHRLAGLKIGVLLGVGAYGRVYRAMLGEKPVAVKIIEVFMENEEELITSNSGTLLPPGQQSSGSGGGRGSGSGSGGTNQDRRSALLEAILSRDLVFPTIVPTFDFFVQEHTGGGGGSAPMTQQVWILQHLCDLGSLYQALDRGLFREEPLLTSPPSLSKILATALDIATAIRYLHKRGIIHSDLNGNNVLMSSTKNTRGFIALVSDFGLSRIAAGAINTQSIGTISHQPPELLNEGKLTKAVDSYAFGVMLSELYLGKRAFAGKSLGYIILQISTGKPCFTLPDDGRCPDALRSLVADCVNFDDEKRPTFKGIVPRLEAIVQEYC